MRGKISLITRFNSLQGLKKFPVPFEDAEQVLIPEAAQDLHIAGAALRAERPEPRDLVATLAR